MSSLDATHVYKGFRLQALYTLYRILDDKMNLVFEPEGKEDLSILDSNNNLKEVIQVKAYSKNLSLSSLKPNKPNSFFYRIRDLIVDNSTPPRVIIASFGEVSDLFYQALINRNELKLNELAKDIMTYNIVDNIDDASRIVHNISLTLLNEDELISLICDKIKNIIVGLEPRCALSLLLNWIMYASERKKKLNRSKILEDISAISRFLSEWKTHHEEWHKTIIPIIDKKIEIEEGITLSSEFYHGFSANYNHILAKADVIRHKKLLEIKDKFSKGNIVIIHAASGQGKTALAYRYLHDYYPDMWRFKIKLVESRTHALNIARALSGHVNAIGVPIIVYLDVSARDLNWVDLVKDLSDYKNINILVTIREEDWKRSIVYYDVETTWSEIELSFNKEDAMLIYNSISRRRKSFHFLNFEDAWVRFGCEGPLMEFIYLITQGKSLKEKLMQQVRRIEDEVRDDNSKNNEIKLLRLVSIASAFDAQLKIKPLINYLNLPVPERTLELMEKEYLIVVDANESLVRGVHPIRSQILVDILSSFINPWAEDAAICLPMIYEPDIEIFCFYAFSRCRTKIKPFLDAINKYRPDRWISIIGITRALLWLGVYDYVELNRDLISKAFNDSGNSFIFLLDPDIAEVGHNIHMDYLKTLTDISLITEDRRKQILEIRSNQAKKDLVFVYARNWLREAFTQPSGPISDDDWDSVAELLFWSKYLGLNCPPEGWINELGIDKIINNIPIEKLGEVISSLYYRYGSILSYWLDINRPNLIERYRNETRTISFKDNGREIEINYIVNFDVSNESDIKSKDLIHEEANRNINLLIKLFPDREVYTCQGYGYNIYDKALPFDSTKFRINRSDYIAIYKWPISLNAIFRGLCENLFRPKTWDEYANNVLNLRRNLIISLELLESALINYFPNRSPKKVYGDLIDVNIWQSYIWKISTAPLLPVCALDEWGYASESTADSSIQNGLVSPYNRNQIARNSLSLRKYRPYLTSYNNYINNLWKFFVQSTHSMIYNHARRRHNPNSKYMSDLEAKGVKPGFRRLSCVNLATVLEILPAFQLWFKQLFGYFFDPSELDNLEKVERNIFYRIWSMWYYFNFKPTQIIKYPLKELPEKMNSLSASIIKDIKEEFSKIKTQDVSIFIKTDEVLWDKERALWILLDTPKLINVYEVLDYILISIFKCVNSSQKSQLNRFLFNLYWPSIAVIPVFNGKCIIRKGWRFDSTALLFGGKEGLGWWNYITKYQIPQASLKELNLQSWDMDIPTAWIELMEFVSQISLMVKHLRSLNNITELDSMGKQITQRHFQAIIDKVSKMLSALNTIFPIILEDINRLIADQGISDNIINSAQLMGEVCKKVNPIKQGNDGTIINIDMNFVIEWSDKLEEASNYAALSYLFRLFQENHLGDQSDQNPFIEINTDDACDPALPS